MWPTHLRGSLLPAFELGKVLPMPKILDWRLLLPILAFGVVVHWASRANACSCVPIELRVVPGVGSTVATNANVRLEWDTRVTRLAGSSVVLRRVRRRGHKTSRVRTDLVWGTAHERGSVEVSPRFKLRKYSRYQVVIVHPGGEERMVGEFMTGGKPDTSAPRWAGLDGASFLAGRADTQCTPHDDRVQLSVAATEFANGGPVGYAVWVVPSGRPIDYATRPTFIDGPRTDPRFISRVITVGRAGSCGESVLDIEALRLRNIRSVRVGVRPVDLSGNLGAPAEALVDLQD